MLPYASRARLYRPVAVALQILALAETAPQFAPAIRMDAGM